MLLQVQNVVAPELQTLLRPPPPRPPAPPAAVVGVQASPFIGVPVHAGTTGCPPWPNGLPPCPKVPPCGFPPRPAVPGAPPALSPAPGKPGAPAPGVLVAPAVG